MSYPPPPPSSSLLSPPSSLDSPSPSSSSTFSTFSHPLSSRYSSQAMRTQFSESFKIQTWRRLWFYLAEAQQTIFQSIEREREREDSIPPSNEPSSNEPPSNEPPSNEPSSRSSSRSSSLPMISNLALSQLSHSLAHDTIDFQAAALEEQACLHDVMAHLRLWSRACPAAAPILHLGATSCDITDNAETLILQGALDILLSKLISVLRPLTAFCFNWRSLPCLGYTHFQPAQLTTVGKRACLWLQDLLADLKALQRAKEELRFRGLKGTTGTQASFLALLAGSESHVQALEALFCSKAGCPSAASIWPITGQTTPRRADYELLSPLLGLAASASKMTTDLRLLAHSKQMEEPFSSSQIGSSAMAYKRNPMKSERVAGLARYLLSLGPNAYQTAASAWLERSLDDSANRRLVLPEAFLAADAILICLSSIVQGLVVWPMQLAAAIDRELPFLATESILMAMVAAGGNRQEAHEHIRVASLEAADRLKRGQSNNLLDLLKAHPYFAPIRDQIDSLSDPAHFIGCAPSQVERFLADHVEPVLAKYKDWPDVDMKLIV